MPVLRKMIILSVTLVWTRRCWWHTTPQLLLAWLVMPLGPLALLCSPFIPRCYQLQHGCSILTSGPDETNSRWLARASAVLEQYRWNRDAAKKGLGKGEGNGWENVQWNHHRKYIRAQRRSMYPRTIINGCNALLLNGLLALAT